MTKYLIIHLQEGSAAQFSFDDLNYSLSQDEVACLLEKGVLLTSEALMDYAFSPAEDPVQDKRPPAKNLGFLPQPEREEEAVATYQGYGCHRCRKFFLSHGFLPDACPHCHSNTWSTFTLLYCCECHALFEYYWHPLAGGNPYDRFPGCPACQSERWCPAENERLRSLPPEQEIQAQAEAKRQKEAEAFTRLMEMRKQQEMKRLGLQTRSSQPSPAPLSAPVKTVESEPLNDRVVVAEAEAFYKSIAGRSYEFNTEARSSAPRKGILAGLRNWFVHRR